MHPPGWASSECVIVAKTGEKATAEVGTGTSLVSPKNDANESEQLAAVLADLHGECAFGVKTGDGTEEEDGGSEVAR